MRNIISKIRLRRISQKKDTNKKWNWVGKEEAILVEEASKCAKRGTFGWFVFYDVEQVHSVQIADHWNSNRKKRQISMKITPKMKKKQTKEKNQRNEIQRKGNVKKVQNVQYDKMKLTLSQYSKREE